MTFEYSDAWLLGAIAFSENGNKGAALTEVIRAADYLNHAIPTYAEFASATEKLTNAGLIAAQNERLKTTDIFKQWWIKKYQKKSRINLVKAIEDIQKYLHNTHKTTDSQPPKKMTQFNETDFTRSINEYQEIASITLARLTGKKMKD